MKINIKFGFSVVGLIIFMVPMMINILYVLLPPKEKQKEKKQPVWDEIEQASRLLYAVAMCIIISKNKYEFKSIFFYGMVLFVVLYYIVWIRYFINGRKIELLGTNFLFIPMPLAVFPILYYLCGALWLENNIAAILIVMFGIAHNVISYRNLYIKNGKA